MLTLERYLASEPETCPGCRQPVRQVVYVWRDGASSAQIFRCDQCCLMFLRPLLLDRLDDRQMNHIDTAEMYNLSLVKAAYINLFLKREAARVRELLGRRALRLLDIGCGTGWMTHLYARHGFRVVGLEPSPVRAEVAADRYGIEVVRDYLENTEFHGEFDVVVMRHVLEHFAEPAAALHKAREALAEGGLLLATVPNIDSLGRSVFGANWSWGLPHHCQFFNPQALTALLDRCGFELLHLTRTPSPFYTPSSVMRKYPGSRLARLVGSRRLLATLALAPLPLCGWLIGRGDNLNVIARR
ncbi:MAG: class I SAM-dependent methyltransferase [Desulfuromonadales bacterium]|nr:class I SAM-dependent methyltransferase [Desulfuromonadales bacterium]